MPERGRHTQGHDRKGYTVQGFATMEKHTDLKNELVYLGLFDKVREIYREVGKTAAISYIRSSYRLLSKVYHPDLNPENRQTAGVVQQHLNRLSRLLNRTSDEEIIELIARDHTAWTAGKDRILVVEDEPGLRDLFRDILIIEGYDVRVAEDGARGYVLYREFRPHLIFADVVIPKMSGLELVKKIREITPQVKVIFVSGFFGIEPLKQELDAVVLKYGYGVLSKPFKISRMLGLVENYLRGYGYGQSGVNVFA